MQAISPGGCSIAFALRMRRSILKMVANAKASHVGGALSVTDIVAVLYNDVMKFNATDAKYPNRDRLVYSKGHCCTAIYAALAEVGFIAKEELLTYGQNGSRLLSHVSHHVPGVEFSTGSLGHGLPYAAGLALAGKRTDKTWRTFAILSDGELDEGSNWEAILFAPHHSLSKLTLVVDYNKIQSLGRINDVLRLDPLPQKFKAFGWRVEELDGHDHGQLRSALGAAEDTSGKPLCIIAHTVKGKGVPFMENELKWHYSPPNAIQLEQALEALDVQK